MSLPPKGEQARNLVYTMRFELPQPVKSFSITTYDPDDLMRVEVDKAYAAGRLHARQASDLQVRVRARPAGVRRQGDVPPSLTPSVPAYRPWLGIFFMCVACALFPVQNAVVKLLTGIYPFQEVVWVRLATHLVLMCVVFLPRRGLALLRTRAPVQQVICSAGLLGATFFFFSAAKSVGVTEAIAISFISPLVVTFLAWPMLGERITVVRLASVVIGFAGVLIVIRPGSSVFQWASLLIVASAVSYAVYQIIVRRVAAVDSAGHHRLLQRARLHAGDVVVRAVPLEDAGQLARRGADALAGRLRWLRPLLRGARLQLCSGQPDRAAELHPDDRFGRGRLPDVRRSAGLLHLDRQRGDHRRRPARGLAGPAKKPEGGQHAVSRRRRSADRYRPGRASGHCSSGPASCRCPARTTGSPPCRPRPAGFEALYLSGAAMSASMGLPDLGVITVDEVCFFVRQVARASGLPVLVDGDTGYGEALNVMHMVRAFEEAGAGAVHIEDQLLPKKCGHLNDKKLADPHDMAAKVHAAAKARRDLVIIARTDAAASEGIDGAVARAKLYLEAGADAIFPEALTNAEMFRAFAKAMPGVKLLANMTEFGRTPFFTASRVRGDGLPHGDLAGLGVPRRQQGAGEALRRHQARRRHPEHDRRDADPRRALRDDRLSRVRGARRLDRADRRAAGHAAA